MNRSNGHINAWTPEREETVRVMWQAGSSASEIAKALACGFSRNAIIGKVHRKGWTVRGAVSAEAKPAGRNHARDQRRAAMRAARPAKGYSFGNGGSRVVKAPRKPAPVEQPLAELVPLERLGARACKWPIGDPQDAAFGFCGCVREADDPYCAWHMRKAYEKPKKAKPAPNHAESERKLREAKRWAA